MNMQISLYGANLQTGVVLTDSYIAVRVEQLMRDTGLSLTEVIAAAVLELAVKVGLQKLGH